MNGLVREVISDTGRLSRIEPAWWSLWRDCPTATPFQSPAWLLPWWTTFAPGQLRVIALWAGDELAALAPLWLEPGPLGDRVLPLGLGVSDYIDFLARTRDIEDPTAVIAQTVAEWPWAEWEWAELPPDALARRLTVTQASRGERAASACPVLHLADPNGPAIPASQRRKLRMSRHRLDRGSPWRIVRTTERSPGHWAATLARLHAARWSERGSSGVFIGQMQAFISTAIPQLMNARLARLHALELAGADAGIYFGFTHQRQEYAYIGGFDPAAAFYSPGTVLIGDVIDAATQDGAQRLHFLRGSEAYKYAWGAVDHWNTRLCFHRERP